MHIATKIKQHYTRLYIGKLKWHAPLQLLLMQSSGQLLSPPPPLPLPNTTPEEIRLMLLSGEIVPKAMCAVQNPDK